MIMVTWSLCCSLLHAIHTAHCQGMAAVQCIQSKEEFRLYTQVYTFKSLHLCDPYSVCIVIIEEWISLLSRTVFGNQHLLVQDFHVSSYIEMFNEFEATAFLILGPFSEAVRGMTSGFRQSSISCPCASYFSPRKKPVVIWSSQSYIFLPTMVLLKKRSMDVHSRIKCCTLVSKKMLCIPLPNHRPGSHVQT